MHKHLDINAFFNSPERVNPMPLAEVIDDLDDQLDRFMRRHDGEFKSEEQTRVFEKMRNILEDYGHLI